jgi:hypothetical protein
MASSALKLDLLARLLCETDDAKLQSIKEILNETEVSYFQMPKRRHFGLVAQLNADGDKIVAVHSNLHTAAHAVGLRDASSITQAIHKQSFAAKQRWMTYDECSDELKATFEGTLPEERRWAPSSKRVERINPADGTVDKSYPTMGEAIKEMKFTHPALKKACDTRSELAGYLWRRMAGKKAQGGGDADDASTSSV